VRAHRGQVALTHALMVAKGASCTKSSHTRAHGGERCVRMEGRWLSFTYSWWRKVHSVCLASGSTHTESGKLYRKVNHRARPKVASRQRPKRASTQRPSPRRLRRRAPHTEHGLGVLSPAKRKFESTEFGLTRKETDRKVCRGQDSLEPLALYARRGRGQRASGSRACYVIAVL